MVCKQLYMQNESVEATLCTRNNNNEYYVHNVYVNNFTINNNKHDNFDIFKSYNSVNNTLTNPVEKSTNLATISTVV